MLKGARLSETVVWAGQVQMDCTNFPNSEQGKNSEYWLWTIRQALAVEMHSHINLGQQMAPHADPHEPPVKIFLSFYEHSRCSM